MEKVKRKLWIPLLAVVFVFALVIASVFTSLPVFARANVDEAETVTLSDAGDFVITDGELSGLSDAGNAKIAEAESYSIVVPDSVTAIKEGAFAGLGRLTSLTIPFVGKNATATGAEGVLGYMFGKIAYVGASQTNQVYSSNETPNQTFDPDTYNLDCNYGDTYAGYIPKMLAEITVTGGTISHGAFSYCISLKKVTLQNIDTVGDLAFFGSNVCDVNLGDVTVINRRAFQRTHYLREIDLNSITRIGRFAFAESGLYKVELPTCLGENLEQYAFFNCVYLSSIKVNAGVKVVKTKSGTGQSPFDSSPRIVEVIDLREGEDVDKSVEFWAGSYYLVSNYMTVSEDAAATSAVFNIDGYLFKNTGTECIFISYIGEDRHINMPDASALEDYGVTSYKIIDQAFNYGDRNFITAYIPSCVTKIGNSAFLDSGLVKITIGEEREDGVYPEINYTPNATFWGCSSLKEVFIFSSLDVNPMFGYYEYQYDSDNNSWNLIQIDLKDVHLYNAAKGGEVPESKVQVIGDYLFYESGDSIDLISYNGADSTINLPDREAVKAVYPDSDGSYRIGSNVFADNADITGVSIPEAVTEIGELAFKGCNTLINVNIAGNALAKIGMRAFEDCSALAR